MHIAESYKQGVACITNLLLVSAASLMSTPVQQNKRNIIFIMIVLDHLVSALDLVSQDETCLANSIPFILRDLVT